MNLATKAQLDRATNAAREVERLRALLESPDPMDGVTWNKLASDYTRARSELARAHRVLQSIKKFNASLK